MSNQQLTYLRGELTELDNKLIDLLAKRCILSTEIGKIKREFNLKAFDEEQAKKKEEEIKKIAKSKGISGKFIRKIWRNIHHESVKIQQKIMGDVHLLQKLDEKKEKLENRINKRNKKK